MKGFAYFVLIYIVCTLLACMPPENKKKNDISCRDGVEYLQSWNGYSYNLTPHLKMDGSIYLCD